MTLASVTRRSSTPCTRSAGETTAVGSSQRGRGQTGPAPRGRGGRYSPGPSLAVPRLGLLPALGQRAARGGGGSSRGPILEVPARWFTGSSFRRHSPPWNCRGPQWMKSRSSSSVWYSGPGTTSLTMLSRRGGCTAMARASRIAQRRVWASEGSRRYGPTKRGAAKGSLEASSTQPRACEKVTIENDGEATVWTVGVGSLVCYALSLLSRHGRPELAAWVHGWPSPHAHASPPAWGISAPRLRGSLKEISILMTSGTGEVPLLSQSYLPRASLSKTGSSSARRGRQWSGREGDLPNPNPNRMAVGRAGG
jgi:hypothetical protein